MSHLEFELCKLLARTPGEIGKIRRENPHQIAYLEQHIIWEAKEREKARKEMERKSKAKKHRKH